MKKLGGFLLLLAMTSAQAQPVGDTDWRVIEKLNDRGTYRFIGNEVQRVLNEDTPHTKDVVLVVQENGVNRLCVTLDKEVLAQYAEGKLSLDGVYAAMGLSNDTEAAQEALKVLKPKTNRDAWKPELVLYPQLKLKNSGFHTLYTYAINIAPAIEMNLWKGARFTGQVIVPIATNLHGTYKQVRPGVMSIEQRFAWGKHWHGSVAAGNFTHERMGAQAELWWRSASGRWEYGAEIGSTVESVVTQNEGWRISNMQRVNGLAHVIHYQPEFNLWMKVSAGRFVYGDWGARADIVRAFGEHTIGLYGVYSEGEGNLGFTFSVPLPTKRFMKNRGARVRAAEYFDMEYSMRSWGKFEDERLGRGYRTQPGKTWTKECWQPDYIRYFLRKELERKKR